MAGPRREEVGVGRGTVLRQLPTRQPGAPAPSSRADLVALLRVASIDAEVARLQGSLHEIVGLLERQRADLGALGALVDADRAHAAGVEHGAGEVAPGLRSRLRDNETAYAELARALGQDQADAHALSAELQRKTAEFGEEHQALLARVSPPLAGLYTAALREGRRPALTSLRNGACAACGARLEPGALRSLRDACQILPCSGCARLLHDPGWVERDFMPATLPVRKVGP